MIVGAGAYLLQSYTRRGFPEPVAQQKAHLFFLPIPMRTMLRTPTILFRLIIGRCAPLTGMHQPAGAFVVFDFENSLTIYP